MSQTINCVPYADLNQNLELMGSETDIDEATSMLVMDVGDDICGEKLEILVVGFLRLKHNLMKIIKVSPS